MSLKSVEGKTYLITGGASGLGGACTKLFHEKGANVVILDINQEDGDKLIKEIDPSQKRLIFCVTDVTDEESVKKAVQQAKDKFQQIHGLVNCAGVGAAQRTANAKAPHDYGLFKKVIDINLNGTFNVSRLVAHEMCKQKADNEGERGVIIHTASVAAFEGQVGQVSYAASKGAVVAMTIVMARDLANMGIRVNTIAPGMFDTPLMSRASDEVRKSLEASVPFPKRFGRPPEFAELVLHMVKNPFLNGETVRLDGSIRMPPM